jgi:hypothetical protein
MSDGAESGAPCPEAAAIEELEPVVLDAVERQRIREAARQRRHYRVAGQIVDVAGNSPDVLDRFDFLFGPLRAEGGNAGPREVFFHLDRGAEPPVFTVFSEAEAFRLADPQVIRWPFVILGRLVIGSITTHACVHSGAVVIGGRAVLLTGGSGLGKSTLVAHLARRGAGFLTDELSPVELATRMVEPHALRIGIRPGPAHALADDRVSLPFSMMGDTKRLVDPSGWSGRPPSERSPLGMIFILSRNATQEVATVRRPAGPVLLAYTQWNEALAADLETTFRARVIESRPKEIFTEALVELGDLAEALPQLRARARAMGSLLAYVQYEDVLPPDFSVAPQVVPLAAAAGVLEIIKRIPSSARNRLLESVYHRSMAAMVLGLSGVFADTPFYRLRPGRLDETIALVEKLAAAT